MTTIPNSYSVTPNLLNQRGHFDLTHLIHHSFYTFLLSTNYTLIRPKIHPYTTPHPTKSHASLRKSTTINFCIPAAIQ